MARARAQAKVAALASEVEGFSIKATFSKSLASNLGDSPPVGAGGWTYFYNPTAAVGSKASYKPLLDEPQQGNQNCLRPTRGTFPAAIPAGYGHICSIDGSAPAGHVGPGKNNEGLEFDVGIIAAYTVPEDQFYSILDSTLLARGLGLWCSPGDPGATEGARRGWWAGGGYGGARAPKKLAPLATQTGKPLFHVLS